MEFIGIGIAGSITAMLAGWIAYSIRQETKVYRFIKDLEAQDAFYVSPRWANLYYQWEAAGIEAKEWKGLILFIGHKRLAVYPRPPKPDSQPLISIEPQELRGFWRPTIYREGDNEVWIHAEIGETWSILKVRTNHHAMPDIIRALKEITTPEQIKAYRRKRPYPYRGLSMALPAQQSLTGEWELFNPIELYLMPLYLVVFQQGKVQKRFSLEAVQEIAALKRMEGGKPEGLIRFSYEGAIFAFALEDYEAWASSIAEAAKRSLEEPVMRKQKTKDDEWDDVDIPEE